MRARGDDRCEALLGYAWCRVGGPPRRCPHLIEAIRQDALVCAAPPPWRAT